MLTQVTTASFEPSIPNFEISPRQRKAVAARWNGLFQRVCHRLGLPEREAYTFLAIHSCISTNREAEPGELVEASLLAIAQRLKAEGNPDSQRRNASRKIAALEAWQRRIGKRLIFREPGKKDERSSAYCDCFSAVAEEAEDLSRSKEWKPELKGWRRDDALAEWIIARLPDLEESKPEQEEAELPEYLRAERVRKRILRDVERELGRFSPSCRKRLSGEIRQGIEKIDNSVAKCLPALMLSESGKNETVLSYAQGGRDSLERVEEAGKVPEEEAKTEAKTEAEIEQDFDKKYRTVLSGRLLTAKDLSILDAHFEKLESWQISEAFRTLEAFETVQAGNALEVLMLEDETKKPLRVMKPKPGETATILPDWLSEAERLRASLVFRMEGSGPGRSRGLIQIDDCDRETVERLSAFSFLSFETSPRNYQTWLKLEASGEAELHSVRDRLLEALGKSGKGNGGSYGSMRWPGSRNWKPEHVRNGFGFPIAIYRVSPGRVVTEAELEAAGLLACKPPELPEAKPASLSLVRIAFNSDFVRWPNYSQVLTEAGGDRSRADYRFLCDVQKAGRSREEAEAALFAVSERARESGAKYVERTLARVYDKL